MKTKYRVLKVTDFGHHYYRLQKRILFFWISIGDFTSEESAILRVNKLNHKKSYKLIKEL